jgi:RNA polymerase sigma-70 factor (ECF subfamily)
MGALYRTHAQSLYRFLLRRTLGDREAAQDLLQETMLRAWRKLDTLPADTWALRPWLFTVARNVTIDVARARQARAVEVNTGDIAWATAPTDAFDGVLTAQTLREALLRLSPEHRAVLIELYYRDASVAETAARVGVPEGTVRSRSYYALRALRAILGEEVA